MRKYATGTYLVDKLDGNSRAVFTNVGLWRNDLGHLDGKADAVPASLACRCRVLGASRCDIAVDTRATSAL